MPGESSGTTKDERKVPHVTRAQETKVRNKYKWRELKEGIVQKVLDV